MTWVTALAALFAAADASAAPPPGRETALRQLAHEAKVAHRSGDYRRAAELYWQGWLLDPTDGGFLYGSARALHLAGDLDLAIARYQAFLELPRQAAELVARTQQYLRQAQQQRAAKLKPADLPAPVTAAAEAPPPATDPPAAPTPVESGGQSAAAPDAPAPLVVRAAPAAAPSARPLWLAAAGAVLAAAGAVVAGWAELDLRSFQSQMAPGFRGETVVGYHSRDAALQEAHAIGLRRSWGWGCLAAGVTAGLSGALWHYLKMSSDPQAEAR